MLVVDRRKFGGLEVVLGEFLGELWEYRFAL